jgi:hypothetical protein
MVTPPPPICAAGRQRRHFSLAKLIPVVVFLSVPPAIDWLGVDMASWLWLAIWPLNKLLNLVLPPSPRGSTSP